MNVKHVFDTALPIINAGDWFAPSQTSLPLTSEGWDVWLLEDSGLSVDASRVDVPVLAVDPGYAAAGMCYIDYTGQITLLQARHPVPKPSPADIAARALGLLAIADWAVCGAWSDLVVEGAAYGKQFGQPNLGLMRGALLAGHLQDVGDNDTVHVIAPQRVKALVHGKDKPDYHKLSKKYPDATAALALALAFLKEQNG